MAKLTITEYCSKFAVAESTVRYRVHTNKLQSEMIEGKLHVIVDDSEINAVSQENHSELITELRQQNEYLQQELSQALQRENEARERSDTIVLQLTKQLENQTLMLEDTRKESERSLWRRVKTVFAPLATSR